MRVLSTIGSVRQVSLYHCKEGLVLPSEYLEGVNQGEDQMPPVFWYSGSHGGCALPGAPHKKAALASGWCTLEKVNYLRFLQPKTPNIPNALRPAR